MRRSGLIGGLITVLLMTLAMPGAVLAQTDSELTLFTPYPSQVIGVGESISLDLTLRTTGDARVVDLEAQGVPENWNVTFRGDNRIVESVYVVPDSDATVSLRVEPPADVAADTYRFTVIASGAGVEANLPLAFTVQEKLPPRLAFETELPVIRGESDSTFRYNLTLKNEGDEDLTVDLVAESPEGFRVTFKSSGQDVTSLPVQANASERLNVEAEPLIDVPAGRYPIAVRAEAGETQAATELTAEVVGQADLSLTSVDNRLSGEATIGSETPITLLVQNTGTAPARGVELSSSAPNGWSVTLEPETVDEIQPGQQAEVTARVQPAENAVAGDYMITFNARPADAASESVDFRITVRTSTLWGIVGVALIAVAVGVVALAVARFGRR